MRKRINTFMTAVSLVAMVAPSFPFAAFAQDAVTASGSGTVPVLQNSDLPITSDPGSAQSPSASILPSNEPIEPSAPVEPAPIDNIPAVVPSPTPALSSSPVACPSSQSPSQESITPSTPPQNEVINSLKSQVAEVTNPGGLTYSQPSKSLAVQQFLAHRRHTTRATHDSRIVRSLGAIENFPLFG